MIKCSLNLGGMIGALVVACIMCDILLFKNIPLLSINITQQMISHWFAHWHIVVIGLFPIYVAALFFGASLLGFIAGSIVQRFLVLLKNGCS